MRLLDLTRLVSRAGRPVLTGIDRVELAYLRHLAAQPAPVFGLVRTVPGFLLLDRAGLQCLADRVTGAEPLGEVDLVGRVTRRRDRLRGRVEADLRRVALARCARVGLTRMLMRHLPEGFSYLNVGHANLSGWTLWAVRRVPGSRIAVFVHDVIPLDHPQFTRPGTRRAFARKMAAVSARADLVIHPSRDGRVRTEAQLARFGRVPAGVVAALGVTAPRADAGALPPGLDLDRPWFVTIGTIEARKNHALLLDVWDRLAATLAEDEVPQLFIIGTPGWNGDAVMSRLERGAHSRVRVLSGLSDGAAAELLKRSQGLLFPTLAEGFGLPPAEAAALGVPVICSDLAVLRENLRGYPVYLDPSDSYSWAETISKVVRAKSGTAERPAEWAVPTWDDHFNLVLNLV